MIFKNITLFTLFLLPSFATDVIQEYQNKGIEVLEQRFDYTLTTQDYWNEFLADKNVSMGLYSNFNAILYCDKAQATLKRLSINDHHQLTLEHTNSTFLGEKPGDKLTEGDLKTPTGVYKLTQKLTEVDPFYGPLALVTNYPNSFDKSRNKSGSGIWIHGLPLNGDRDTFTKGCLAIDNEEIQSLEKAVDYRRTALLISPKELPFVTKEDISKLLASFYQWRNAWKYNDIERYLSFYNPDFKRANGMNMRQFATIKRSIFSRNQEKRIDLHHINVIPYPNENNETLFYIQFIENYKAKRVTFNGTKELYVKLIDDKMSILTEN